MTPTPEVQERLRRYVLGQLAEDAREEIEKGLLVNDEVFEELLTIEDEIIDDYLGERLNASDRAAFDNYFLAAPKRHEQLKFGRAFDRYLSLRTKPLPRPDAKPPWWRSSPRAFFSSPWRAVAFATAALVIAFGAWQIFVRQSPVDEGLLALNSAFREQRPLESRISNLNYAPYVVTRGPGEDRTNQEELQRAELTLLNAQKKNSTPAVQHALGKVYLAKKDFDKAIEQFNEALKGAPNNAQVFSDLGVAWLEKGKLDLLGSTPGQGMEELGRSLENLNRAVQLNPNLLEALFNRALCLQSQTLRHQAIENWEEYLRHDSTSNWAAEARRNLKLLQDQKANLTTRKEQDLNRFYDAVAAHNQEAARSALWQNYTSAGNTITNAILDSYLELRRDKRTAEAASKLRALSYVAGLEAQDSGDRFLLDVERFYLTASDAQIEELIKARHYMSEAYANFTSANLNNSVDNYGKAKEIFSRIGDTSEASFAEYRIAHTYSVQPNINKARTLFEGLIGFTERKAYKWLLSQCLYAAANLDLNQSEYSKALERSNQALQLAETVHDINGVLKNLIQLADKYESLNNMPRSFEFLHRAIVLIGKHYPEASQVWGVYIAIAFNLNSLNLHLAALDFQKEALVLALSMNRPLHLSRNYAYLGLTYGKLKSFDVAIEHTKRAFEVGTAFSSQASGQNMMAHSTLQLADLHRQAGNYGSAIGAYDKSIELYNQLAFQHYAYAAHKGKLLCYLAQRDDASTEAELQTVLSLFEQNRFRINEDSNRNTFFDLEQQVYDLAIDFAFSRRQDERRAFEYSESSHARSLNDMMLAAPIVETQGDRLDLAVAKRTGSRGANFISVNALQAELPVEAQVVQYSLLEDKVIIWVVTRSGITARESKFSAAYLEQKVRQYLQGLGSASEQDDDLNQQARELYSVLIAPIEPLLDKHKLVCIVADKILHYIPYRALVSPASGKYFIQEYNLISAASTRVFINSSESARQRANIKEEWLLSVGDPAFDSSSYPSLSRLPSAQREAEAITVFYPTSRLLVTEQATRKAVKSEMEKANVLHLALHYVPDEQSSLLSRLVLAPSPGDSRSSHAVTDALTASDIYQMKLPRTRLAVLSACETGIEQNYRSEGPISIARPFITAGVPLVIASLWRVDSDATADLMTSFHRHRRQERLASTEALRRAQLEMLNGQEARYRSPYYWAGFVTIGGYANF